MRLCGVVAKIPLMYLVNLVFTSPSLSSATGIGTARHWTGESRVPTTGPAASKMT
jgi:hypothetical protein